jgi:hypothetical protein
MRAKFPDRAEQKLAPQNSLGKPKKFFIPYPVKLRRDPKKKCAGMVKKSRDFIRSFPEMNLKTEMPALVAEKKSFDSPIKRLGAMALTQKKSSGSGNQLKLMKNAMILKNKKDEQYKGSSKSVNSTNKLPAYETPKTKLKNNKNQSTQQLSYSDNDPLSTPKPANPKDPVPTSVPYGSGPGLTKPNIAGPKQGTTDLGQIAEVPKEAPTKPEEKIAEVPKEAQAKPEEKIAEVPKEVPAKPEEKPGPTPLGSLFSKKQEPG